ncbi:hypothetical protein [Thalassotalea sp. SU-HH00458]|uniref:hypothetical protein n=1 Tax=Thalassotalea sp. SU-HH00458 TaxID=3127657 RepID=UPI00310225B1
MNLNKLVTIFIVCLAISHVQADPITDIQKCSGIKDSLKRLVCYDNLAKSLKSSRTTKPPVAVRVTEPKKHSSDLVAARPSQTKPMVVKQPQKPNKVDDFGGEHLKKPKESIDEVFFTVKSVKKVLHNKLVITFENGQVWYQTDDNYLKVLPGDRVKLSKGMLGVIYLKTEKQKRRIKVKRRK